MTDTFHNIRDMTTSPTRDAKEAQLKMQQHADPALPPTASGADQRSINLEILREQLRAAKIPVTKRASISEVPQAASDCSFVDGTTRCKLTLCEDSCTQPHSHHRTHQAPLKANAPLVYSRPSISVLSTQPSPAGSPSASLPVSQSNSPQAQYRRASAFGFNLGGRGSVVNSIAGFATPADIASGPPSPLSGSSRDSSAPTSPRQQQDVNPTFVPDFTVPIKEEERENSLAGLMEPAPVSLPQASASSMPADDSYVPKNANMSLTSEFWKLRNRIINLMDYRPAVAGKNTVESRTRQDLAPEPREDFADQEHCGFDPRSPHPPSPVETFDCEISRVNLAPELVQYELKPKQ